MSIAEQPGPVTDFKPSEINKNSCTLGWKKPISDGGSHIVAYVLEMCEGEDKWKLLMKSKLTQYTMTDLEEGKEYFFRVKAINETAEGPSSELSVLAKDQIGIQIVYLRVFLMSKTVRSNAQIQYIDTHPIFSQLFT